LKLAPHECIVALGSNLGDAGQTIEAAFEKLRAESEHIETSSLWHTAPVDCPPGSPDFVNAVAIVQVPAHTPESFLLLLRRLEAEAKRPAIREKNAPRTLDLDMIAFGAQTRTTEALTLPHPRAAKRTFVLGPLAELRPQLNLFGDTVATLLQKLQNPT
jgi:2-amino-4-hydroxy-6-hydroxymethyldihydropteridine diphosphokinase